MSTTTDRLSAILARDHKLPPERLTLAASLESLGIDSLGTIELMWNIEDAFQIQLPSDAVGLVTLGDLVRCIDELVAARGRGAALEAPVVPAPNAT